MTNAFFRILSVDCKRLAVSSKLMGRDAAVQNIPSIAQESIHLRYLISRYRPSLLKDGTPPASCNKVEVIAKGTLTCQILNFIKADRIESKRRVFIISKRTFATHKWSYCRDGRAQTKLCMTHERTQIPSAYVVAEPRIKTSTRRNISALAVF